MEITIENPKVAFTQHLSQPHNSRILFSGNFGTGKSYFLRNYFEKENDKFNVFWISPINYVVGANQDIFEWIKIDIAKELITRFLPPEQEIEVSKNFLIQFYLYKNAGSLFSKLISTLTGKYLDKETGIPLLDSFKKEIEAYKEFEKDATEELKSDFEKLQSYINAAFQVKGSIYEDDIVTRILKVSLEVLKQENKKESILIIDDLDRLDPEHIFRILNILSVHESHFDSNKFGFDKVILCCDLNNIESIYKYRYGVEVDFEGYIEKFFTYEPFHFTNRDSIIAFCEQEFSFFNLSKSTITTLSLLLVCMVKYNKLKIRNLKKITSIEKLDLEIINPMRIYDITLPNSHRINATIFDRPSFKVDFNKYEIIKGLYLLSLAVGGIDKLVLAIEELAKMNLHKDRFNSNYLPDLYISICIMSHLSSKLDKETSKAFFYTINIGNEHNKIINVKAPFALFFTKEFQLSLKWNRNEKYYSNGDYFEEAYPQLGSNAFKDENEKKRVSNFANLLNEIQNIVNFIAKNNFFNNIKQ